MRLTKNSGDALQTKYFRWRPSRLSRTFFTDAFDLWRGREFWYVIFCMRTWRSKKCEHILSETIQRFSPHAHNNIGSVSDIKTIVAGRKQLFYIYVLVSWSIIRSIILTLKIIIEVRNVLFDSTGLSAILAFVNSRLRNVSLNSNSRPCLLS